MSRKLKLTLLLSLPLLGFGVLVAVLGLGLGNDPRALPSARLLAVGVIGAVAFVAVYLTQEQAPVDEGAQVKVRVPELSSEAQEGQVVFNENCVTCHGDNAAGTRQGPPLVHRIYEPSHHGNAAFRRATKQGVRAHHWSYGNMPPIGISDAGLSSIIGTYGNYSRRMGFPERHC